MTETVSLRSALGVSTQSKMKNMFKLWTNVGTRNAFGKICGNELPIVASLPQQQYLKFHVLLQLLSL